MPLDSSLEFTVMRIFNRSFKFVVFISISLQIFPISPLKNFLAKYRYRTKKERKNVPKIVGTLPPT